MTLLHEIESLPERQLFVLPDGNGFSRQEVVAWASSIESLTWAEKLKGDNVGICCSDSTLVALLILRLDGVAARVVLLPSELPSETIATLAASSGVGTLVSDRLDASAIGIPLAPMVPQLSRYTESSQQTTAIVLAQTEWILPTSGTTRTPKLVAYSLDILARTVKRDSNRWPDLRWGLLYDLNRFAGFQVYLQALLGGASLCMPRKKSSLEETLAAFANAGCNALSATPTLWRKILMTPGCRELPLRLITLGGEIADQAILLALASCFPSARITHIYASTEAGVGFSVTDGKEGFPAEYLLGAIPSANLRVSAEGILELKPSIGGQRYLGESVSLSNADGFVSTGDKVRIEGDRVYFMGRDSGAINVGGNKVQPEKIEGVLLKHPAVAMASIIAKRSGITGSLVEARVTLYPGSDDSSKMIQELREWCMPRLERYEVPAFIRIVPTLQLNTSGKISRQ